MQNKKYWTSISIDGIKQALKEMPAKVRTSDKYGQQLSADVKFWEDGSASITVWNAETQQRINIGKIMISKHQDGAPAQQLDPPATDTAGFDSPF